MPWCATCRREVTTSEGTCPTCGARLVERPEAEATESRPAHLAILDAPAAAAPAVGASTAAAQEATPEVPAGAEEAALAASAEGAEPSAAIDASEANDTIDNGEDEDENGDGDRPAPKRRLVSSAGPAVPIRKQANDSVPSSWMARLEAARLVTGPPSGGTGSSETQPASASPAPGQPPPLRPSSSSNGASRSKEAPPPPVGKPAHLLVAQLEEEDRKRSDQQAERVAALFANDRSDEIAKVEIPLTTDVRRKRVPDWVIVVGLIVIVLAVVGIMFVRAKQEPGPVARIDPAVQAAAEKRRMSIAALEEGHKLAIEGKARADDAIKAYTRALELDPTLASAERGLAIAYGLKDDDTSAVAHYKSYLILSPEAADADDVRKIVERYEKKKEAEKAAKEAPPPETKAPPAHKAKHKAKKHK